MDDRRNDVQPIARARARRVPADGIIGRLTYTPAQGDEGIGQIRRNRAKDESEFGTYPSSPSCAHRISASFQASRALRAVVCSYQDSNLAAQ